jgi:hypothetical protein
MIVICRRQPVAGVRCKIRPGHNRVTIRDETEEGEHPVQRDAQRLLQFGFIVKCRHGRFVQHRRPGKRHALFRQWKKPLNVIMNAFQLLIRPGEHLIDPPAAAVAADAGTLRIQQKRWCAPCIATSSR